MFNLDNLTAWQRRKLWPWGLVKGVPIQFPVSAWKGSPPIWVPLPITNSPHPTPPPLQTGVPKLPEILTQEVRGGSQVIPVQLTDSETYLRSCDEEVGEGEVQTNVHQHLLRARPCPKNPRGTGVGTGTCRQSCSQWCHNLGSARINSASQRWVFQTGP